MMVSGATIIVPAIVGMLTGLLASLAHSWVQDRRTRSFELASEYLGKSFIMHRHAVNHLSELVADDNIESATIEAVARGFWFPGSSGAYVGEVIDGLTLHQHLEIELGWYRRVGYAVKSHLVDVRSLRAQLGGSLDWSACLIRDLCDEIAHQVNDAPPEWITAVILAQRKLVANERALVCSHHVLRR
jgi:hypothetical protein